MVTPMPDEMERLAADLAMDVPDEAKPLVIAEKGADISETASDENFSAVAQRYQEAAFNLNLASKEFEAAGKIYTAHLAAMRARLDNQPLVTSTNTPMASVVLKSQLSAVAKREDV